MKNAFLHRGIFYKGGLFTLIFISSFISMQVLSYAASDYLDKNTIGRYGYLQGGAFISWVNSILIVPHLDPEEKIISPYITISNPTVRASESIRDDNSLVASAMNKKILIGEKNTNADGTPNIGDTLEIYGNSPTIAIYGEHNGEKSTLLFEELLGNTGEKKGYIEFEIDSGKLRIGNGMLSVSPNTSINFQDIKINNNRILKGNQYCLDEQKNIDPTKFINEITTSGDINCTPF